MAVKIRSLRAKLTILILVAFLPVVALEMHTAQVERDRVENETKAEAMRLSRLCESNERAILESARQLLMALSELQGVQTGQPGDCDELFAKLLKANPSYSIIGALDTKGNVRCSAPKAPKPTNLAERKFFQRALESRSFAVGEFLVGRISGKPTIHMAYPIATRAGETTGVVYVGLDLRAMSEFGSRVTLPPGAVISLTNDEGVFLIRYPDPDRWIGRHSSPEVSSKASLGPDGEGVFQAVGSDGEKRIYAVNRIEVPSAGNLYVSVGISEAVAYAPFRRQLTRELGLVTTGAVATLVAVWILGGAMIVRPAKHLVKVSRQISAGNLKVRSSLAGETGEFNEIGAAFNQMADTLAQRISELNDVQHALRQSQDELESRVERRTEELHRARERLVGAIENLDAGFVMYGADERLVICNQTFRKMLGACGDTIQPGMTFEEILREFLRCGGTVEGMTDPEAWIKWRLETFHAADGRIGEQKLNGRWIRVSERRMRDGGVVSLRTDVTSLKDIQESLLLRDRAIAALNSGVIVTDPSQPDNPIVDVNPAFERITGYTKEEVLGRNCRFLQGPEKGQPASDLLHRDIREMRETQVVIRNYRKDGTPFWNEVKIAPVRDSAGRLTHFVGVLTDVSAAVDARQALERAAEELRRSNEELEQFAYVASHDLQEPLRMVASYTQLLARRYRDKLDENAQEFIGFAVDGAQRMQSFIQDLLRYSRVGTHGRPFERLDAGPILHRALENLRFAIDEKHAEVVVGEMPVVVADPVQLTQLFQNLIGNALKFSGDRPLKIEVSAVRRDGEWEFSVRDNGIGIDPKDKERIFVIFQRLHSRQEYRGTGIGLAICKKIVERHGGRIWVESEPGEGANFCFTIADKESGIETRKGSSEV